MLYLVTKYNNSFYMFVFKGDSIIRVTKLDSGIVAYCPYLNTLATFNTSEGSIVFRRLTSLEENSVFYLNKSNVHDINFVDDFLIVTGNRFLQVYSLKTRKKIWEIFLPVIYKYEASPDKKYLVIYASDTECVTCRESEDFIEVWSLANGTVICPRKNLRFGRSWFKIVEQGILVSIEQTYVYNQKILLLNYTGGEIWSKPKKRIEHLYDVISNSEYIVLSKSVGKNSSIEILNASNGETLRTVFWINEAPFKLLLFNNTAFLACNNRGIYLYNFDGKIFWNYTFGEEEPVYKLLKVESNIIVVKPKYIYIIALSNFSGKNVFREKYTLLIKLNKKSNIDILKNNSLLKRIYSTRYTAIVLSPSKYIVNITRAGYTKSIYVNITSHSVVLDLTKKEYFKENTTSKNEVDIDYLVDLLKKNTEKHIKLDKYEESYVLKDIYGKHVTIDSSKKIVLLYFFYIGCTGCEKALPWLKNITKYSNLMIVCVDTRPNIDTYDRLVDYALGHGMPSTWHIILDYSNELVKKYNVVVAPTIVLLHSNKALYKFEGYAEKKEEYEINIFFYLDKFIKDSTYFFKDLGVEGVLVVALLLVAVLTVFKASNSNILREIKEHPEFWRKNFFLPLTLSLTAYIVGIQVIGILTYYDKKICIILCKNLYILARNILKLAELQALIQETGIVIEGVFIPFSESLFFIPLFIAVIVLFLTTSCIKIGDRIILTILSCIAVTLAEATRIILIGVIGKEYADIRVFLDYMKSLYVLFVIICWSLYIKRYACEEEE